MSNPVQQTWDAFQQGNERATNWTCWEMLLAQAAFVNGLNLAVELLLHSQMPPDAIQHFIDECREDLAEKATLYDMHIDGDPQ